MGRTRRLVILLVLTLAAACLGPVATASADRAFAPRHQEQARGNITSAANTLLTASGGVHANNAVNMTRVDVDSDAATFDSSSATLGLPAGATVTFAGLYWGADTSAGAGGGTAAPAPSFASSALLDTPAAGGYASVTASQRDNSGSRYQAFADVTAAVAAAGAGEYTLANVQAGTGNDRFAGWSLVVVYTAADEPLRSLNVYDGLVSLGGGASPSFGLGGFQTPAGGPVQADLGIVSYEGELEHTPDSAALNGHTLSDAVHAPDNFFNSAISDHGSHVTAKNPDFEDQLGFDSALVDADGLIAAGDTSATLRATSGYEGFILGVVTLATATAPPAVTGAAQDGQSLSATPDSWNGFPMDHGYQWQRCDSTGAACVDIAGATGSDYDLTADDVGSTVRVVVTAADANGADSSASAPTAVVAALPPVQAGPPSISGNPQAGATLTADDGSWSGSAPFDFDYQWQRCDGTGAACVDIAGATGSNYDLTADDVGSTVRVVVTATNPAGSDNAASATSAPVTAAPVPAHPAGPAPGSGDPSGPAPGSGDPAGPLPGGDGKTGAPAASSPARAGLSGCNRVSGSHVVGFRIPRAGRFSIRVGPNGPVTAARPLVAASPAGRAGARRINRQVKRVVYRLDGRRIATRRRAPYRVSIRPALLRRAGRHNLSVRVVPKRARPRVARVQLSSKPCSELFSVVHRAGPRKSLLGLRVDSVSSLERIVFRVPRRLLARKGARGAAGKLRVRIAGRRARSYRLSFPRRRARATTLLAGARRPRVQVRRGRVVVTGLPSGTGGIRLRLNARGMRGTPRATLRARIVSEAGSRTLKQRLGRKR